MMQGPSPKRTLGLVGLICPHILALAGCSLRDYDRLGSAQASSTSGIGGSGGSGATWITAGFGGSGQADSGLFEAGPDPAALVNPSFENGFNGWLIDPPEAAGLYAFVQWPVTGSSTVDGLNELSTWAQSAAFTVRIYQSLTGIEDGRYGFKGHFNFGTGHNAVYLFASGCGGLDRRQDVPQPLPSQWLDAELTGIDVSGGSCDVGIVVDANPNNWLNSDLFSFERMPEDPPADAGGSP